MTYKRFWRIFCSHAVLCILGTRKLPESHASDQPHGVKYFGNCKTFQDSVDRRTRSKFQCLDNRLRKPTGRRSGRCRIWRLSSPQRRYREGWPTENGSQIKCFLRFLCGTNFSGTLSVKIQVRVQRQECKGTVFLVATTSG